MVLKIALAQMIPDWLNREGTLERVEVQIEAAAAQGAQLAVFGEALVPGYPFWPELTGGAVFESDVQKDIFAYYAANAVDIEGGGLDLLCRKAGELGIAIYVGTIEKTRDRGGFSLYATLVYIAPDGQIGSTHRKLMPTYDERLVWSPGDGNGLRVHDLGDFRVGGLNCWENWMPLPRAALYGQGENLHVAVWPGSRRNTEDITRFIAKESRSYVVSVSGMMHADRIPEDVPHAGLIREAASGWLADGGSCVAGPDGQWVLEPQVGEEGLWVVEADIRKVARERQSFDPAGHYSRPDVTRLKVNRKRQKTVKLSD
ncbi:MAG: carbon-nitrogen hydrolase family protein [Xanthomonadales bacterium]|jgi:nitrilase|nr:carbon-nitrogen hydrolase family protein [Xanthomonadales bacterium]MDH3925354.1 carbon-nitrogen hydrolase family protein [Xanthomonadales bacterium]MDH3941674.1 carbon-nitrogen hydrolase family protein [Xanthomonadales bacterium]MDH4002174.1 carbon-nitrogen hydrolase family protein [Xanthomonadales bacterium]